ncbi:hypothetical protein JK363_17290 [Streptomyces sp. 205]|uniref:Muconolactone isomerase domain-containing protein n=1 Tax=Streptomyces coffeae TaxID=621382 RepID=A0ABS1NEB5_9ACTN|nr:hypothetical protein [Streptomyces coffeae]
MPDLSGRPDRRPGGDRAVSSRRSDRVHEVLASLPIWRWTDISVAALATHPQERK